MLRSYRLGLGVALVAVLLTGCAQPLVTRPGAFLRFAVIGDFGTGSPSQEAVAARMCSWHESHPFDIVITTGDNIYPRGEPADFTSKFREPYACLRDRGVRFHAALGNHDFLTNEGRKQIQTRDFGMRARNYIVRESGVRFVIADSNRLDRSWLARATISQQGDRWIVVVFHHPVYSPGSGHGSTRGYEGLPNLFERRGVDLVLNGHDHIYSVSRPIGRVRYVVTGGGGAEVYGCTSAPFSSVCQARHHFLSIEAGSDQILVTAVPPKGPPFHRFATPGN